MEVKINTEFEDATRQQGAGQWTRNGQRTRTGTFSGTLGEGISDHNEQTSEWERSRWEEPGVPHVERDNVPTDSPDLSRRRGRRQVNLPNLKKKLNDKIPSIDRH